MHDIARRLDETGDEKLILEFTETLTELITEIREKQPLFAYSSKRRSMTTISTGRPQQGGPTVSPKVVITLSPYTNLQTALRQKTKAKP